MSAAHDPAAALLARTANLTAQQEGVYRRLLDRVVATGRPLPGDFAGCVRIARAVTPAEKKATRDMLAEFFVLREGAHFHRGDEIVDGFTLEGTGPAPAKKAAPEPKKPSPTAAVWALYCTAYRARYDVEPVRNQVVMGQLAQLVKRIGAEEAPQVAAFYLRSNNGWYVTAGHSVGMLLRDAEKLRTEWFTGRQTTQAAARQADKTGANAAAFGPLLDKARQREGNLYGNR